MANVFTRTNDATPKPNRNTFDLSFVNNMTMKAGVITPCFLKEVMPGDSVQIDATFGFNFQPMVFPVQTDMQANLHFFYVRNRTLWRGWQDFITKQKNKDGDETPPFINLTESNRKMFETGQIGDYLGVPTVKYGSDAESVLVDVKSYEGTSTSRKPFYGSIGFLADSLFSPFSTAVNGAVVSEIQTAVGGMLKNIFNGFMGDYVHSDYTPTEGQDFTQFFYYQLPPNSYKVPLINNNMLRNSYSSNYVVQDLDLLSWFLFDEDTFEVLAYKIVSSNGAVYRYLNYEANSSFVIPKEQSYGRRLAVVSLAFVAARNAVTAGFAFTTSVSVTQDASMGIANSEQFLKDLPFASGVRPDGIRISALPFRAVEAVYNSFYRDDRNNPLVINGQPYYNIWVENQNGGGDSKEYKMYKRNWEADVFTTAVQSPTQGILPLVGVTATGNMTFSDENGKTYYLQAELADDGTIEGISSYSSDMPSGTLRAMVDTISTGISINDFRNVNALQRWLEVGMRKGLRYKDNIEAHFGTAPTYSELDMPEFIGGMSRKVQMNRVVQSVDDTLNDKPLGTLGGYATVLGDGGQKVSKYFDEHGFIIGFITITPKPVYSQQLNKQLFKTELLDYYFPEFAHISMQPILNKELAPLQCRNVDGKRLDDVFGYQRAWYEYLSSVDEVHGDFRTSMRDFLIQRTFDGVPELSEEFLVVGDEEVNAVFAVEDPNVDKIFGQIYFDVKMKRPIPAIGIPKLEA